jgi:hypothetical protein
MRPERPFEPAGLRASDPSGPYKPQLAPSNREDFILSSWQSEGNRSGKDFLIIVNPLLTKKNAMNSGIRMA